MTPTETLRAAADLLESMLSELGRRGVSWSICEIDPPYESHLAFDGDPQRSGVANVILGSGAGGYLECMNPLVGAALVAWLRSEQRLADQLSLAGNKQAEVWVPEALAVARAILGEHKESEDAIDIADADAALADPSPRIPHDEIVARYKIDQSEHKEDNGG